MGRVNPSAKRLLDGMHSFFVPPSGVIHSKVRVDGGAARQMAVVLRMGPGDEVLLLDDTGMEYLVRLEVVGREEVRGQIVERRQAQGEPTVRIILYQGLLKRGKFELVLQKGTELGVAGFVPLVCQRAVPRTREGWEDGHYPRWRRIIQEAAEQSHRGRLPALYPPHPFEDALNSCRGLCLLPWEQEVSTGLRRTIRGLQRNKENTVSLFIGPEGGFSSKEVAQAQALGVVSVSMGLRILRSETATLAAISAVMYELGELGA